MAGTSPPRMGGIEWALLLALSILWGGSYFFAKVALAEIGPFTLAFLRVSIAAASLHIIVRAAGLRMPSDRRLWLAFLGMGLLNNAIPFSLIFWGTAQIASGLAAILNAMTPIFTVLVAHALTRDEKLTAPRGAGVLAGFAGVIVLIGPDVLGGLGTHALAQLSCVAAALVYAFAGIFGRRFKAVPPLVTACGQVTASSALMLPVAALVERPWEHALPGAIGWGAVVGLALASTALAYIIFFRILAVAGATNLLLVTFLIPVSAIILGVLILGETIAPRQLAGMALIGLGLAAIDGRALTLLRRRRAAAALR
ncbi:MAG: DMT family transporter [Alphaproteobacteria bacterium]